MRRGAASLSQLASARTVELAALALLCLYGSWQLLGWIPGPQELTGSLLAVPPGALAAALAWQASRRVGDRPRLRRAWRLVALAVAGQTGGAIAQLIYEYVLDVPSYPTLADPLYLSFYPLLLAGILSFPAAHQTRRQALELAVDCAVVGLGSGAVFVYFILGPEAVANSSALQVSVSLAYPVGDVILMAALAAALLRTVVPTVRRTLRAIACAVAIFAIADLVYGYVVLHSGYQGGDPVDTLYVLAFTILSFAAAGQRADASEAPERWGPRRGAGRVSWPTYAAIAACLSIVVATEHGQPLFPDLSIALIAALVTTLVVVRQLIALGYVRQSRERLTQAQRLAHIGSWEWDLGRDRIVSSEETLRIHGLDPSTPPTSFEASLATVHPDDREGAERAIRTAVETGKPFVYEARIARPDGEERTVLSHVDVIKRGGRVTRVHGTHQDITDRRRTEAELEYRADHDPLTGLFNRARLTRELDALLESAVRLRRRGALVVLDLDNFKILNDTYGHRAGDTVLVRVAEILRGIVGAGFLARIGGDEFAAVLADADEVRAAELARTVSAALRARMDGPRVQISAGVALFDGTADVVADDLLVAADVALYGAKEAGKDRVRVYDGTASETLTWSERIRAALAEDRFVLHAQPIVTVPGGALTRYELLVRMRGEDGELVPPGEFLPIAERLGAINDIDRWVTRRGTELATRGTPVSVNLSAASVGDALILALIREAIGRGMDPDLVMFELTETAATTNLEAASAFMHELRALGCHVALDDFGTGFGSFSYLKHLPACYLKIDMEFIRDIVRNETDQQVVRSITEIAHTLSKRTIAEGVEDAATLAVLDEYGVDYAQGYHVGRPAPVEQLVPGASSAARLHQAASR